MNKNFLESISVEQVKLLYSNASFSLLATIIIAPALALALSFWTDIQETILVGWLLSIFFVTGIRYALVQAFRKNQKRCSSSRWLGLFLAGTFIAGSLWGLSGIFFTPEDELFKWFLVLFVLTGLTGGALASLSANYFAYITFSYPALLPIATQLMLSGTEQNALMSGLIILYLILTTVLARRSNRFIDKTIVLNLERESMSSSIEDQIKIVAEQHERILDTQSHLRRVNELFEAAFDTTHVMYAYLDKDFNIMRVNKAYAHKENKKYEDFIDKNYFSIYPDDENKKIFEQVRDTGEAYYIEEEYFERPDLGSTYWDWSLQPLLGSEREVIGLLLALIDVTAKKQAQIALQEKEDYLHSIMDATIEVILTMDSGGTIEMVNPAVEQVFGYRQEELLGKNISLLMPEGIANKHQHWVDHYLSKEKDRISGRMLDTEGKRKDGIMFPLSVSVSDKVIGGRHVFTSVMRDITEQHNAMDALKVKNTELRYLSSHDALTGLHNRRTADEFLQREWNRAVRAKSVVTVLMIDIDYFKKFNDRYGHQAGDSCLHRVAGAMKSVLNRPSDMVARYGGEEFIAILPETDSQGALLVAENIRQKVMGLEIPHEDSNKQFVTVSIGVGTTQPVKLMNYERLVSCADKALYEAKDSGRNCTVASEDNILPTTTS